MSAVAPTMWSSTLPEFTDGGRDPHRPQLQVRDVHVLVGVPVGGGVVTQEVVHAVMALQQRFASRGWGLEFVTVADALITRSRNALASMVARHDRFTHLVMLDADVVVGPDGVERLVGAGHGVVGAAVALRRLDWDRVRAHLDARPEAPAEELAVVAAQYAVRLLPGARPVDGFVPVRAVGSAAMVVARAALVAMSATDLVTPVRDGLPGPDGDGSGWTFFDPLVDANGTYLSEDYAFCDRWRSMGETVWVDLRTPTRHVGPVTLTGDLGAGLAAALAARHATATATATATAAEGSASGRQASRSRSVPGDASGEDHDHG